MKAKKEGVHFDPVKGRNERPFFMSLSSYCSDHATYDLPDQCKAANNPTDNHIQYDDPDSACQIKFMRHEPEEHASNTEGDTDTDPRQ